MLAAQVPAEAPANPSLLKNLQGRAIEQRKPKGQSLSPHSEPHAKGSMARKSTLQENFYGFAFRGFFKVIELRSSVSVFPD